MTLDDILNNVQVMQYSFKSTMKVLENLSEELTEIRKENSKIAENVNKPNLSISKFIAVRPTNASADPPVTTLKDPVSPFCIFFQEKYEEIKNREPKPTSLEMNIIISHYWNIMSVEERCVIILMQFKVDLSKEIYQRKYEDAVNNFQAMLQSTSLRMPKRMLVYNTDNKPPVTIINETNVNYEKKQSVNKISKKLKRDAALKEIHPSPSNHQAINKTPTLTKTPVKDTFETIILEDQYVTESVNESLNQSFNKSLVHLDSHGIENQQQEGNGDLTCKEILIDEPEKALKDESSASRKVLKRELQSLLNVNQSRNNGPKWDYLKQVNLEVINHPISVSKRSLRNRKSLRYEDSDTDNDSVAVLTEDEHEKTKILDIPTLSNQPDNNDWQHIAVYEVSDKENVPISNIEKKEKSTSVILKLKQHEKLLSNDVDDSLNENSIQVQDNNKTENDLDLDSNKNSVSLNSNAQVKNNLLQKAIIILNKAKTVLNSHPNIGITPSDPILARTAVNAVLLSAQRNLNLDDPSIVDSVVNSIVSNLKYYKDSDKKSNSLQSPNSQSQKELANLKKMKKVALRPLP
ncbi:hypothetical protein O9G_000998 [Rozella allomycis CSF55]|uniref:Uncharacterized protein n=1 Tax=Rozella allomycis (strain CSF55) TaxID=988480 RepID=A0A075AS28_ROZAC|nr:hypothetical protein O9G_000998 [Rozella allomycis CSF55]|eukprot:EPZ31353.1 hypothetical protein O9G_000998 [Rozella allomycis CSF55]